MILLDTHVWIWWVHGDARLPPGIRAAIQLHEEGGIGVSVFSCWEVAMLAARQRIVLPVSVADWVTTSLAIKGVQLLDLTPAIAVESTALPGAFHRDPADQILVATARLRGCPIATLDQKIIDYPHVAKLAPAAP